MVKCIITSELERILEYRYIQPRIINKGYSMSYKTEFIDLMVSAEVLTFGDFTTKSGRKTPFFYKHRQL